VRILIADDDQVNRLILETFLKKWGYDVVTVQEGREAWKLLQQSDAPRMAILDWMMPGMDGVHLCREIRKREQDLYTYLILLTAKDHKKDVQEGFEAGADDYITKPFDSSELKSRLRAGFRILELQEQLVRSRDLLQFQATHDAVTGLWSRAAVLGALQKELARAKRQQNSVGVVLADLDYFKQVNDLHGHLAGDAVLRQAAERMRGSLRAYDTIGRYGGEEFLILAPNTDLLGAAAQAERLRLAVAKSPICTPDAPIPLTVSLGVTVSRAGEACTPESLIRTADEALYRAKERGRNRVECLPLGSSTAALDQQIPPETVPPAASGINQSVLES